MSEFHQIASYKPQSPNYRLLPFRFTELNDHDYVADESCRRISCSRQGCCSKLINHQLTIDDPAYTELRARHFLTDDATAIASDLLAIKLRTRYERLADFTSLHIFVVTLRCEHSCHYCQVSRQSDNKLQFDMSLADADAALGLALRSPSPYIKIEFQGGEPLLNSDLIRHMVCEAERRRGDKQIEFVIATNLALIDPQFLLFVMSTTSRFRLLWTGRETYITRIGRDLAMTATRGPSTVFDWRGLLWVETTYQH